LLHQWLTRVFGEVHTRLVAFSLLTLGSLLLIAVPVSRKAIMIQISRREHRVLQQNIDAFNQFILEKRVTKGSPSSLQLQAFMKEFLRSQLPEDDQFLISIIDSRFHAASPVALPTPLRPGSPVMTAWERSNSSRQGIIETSDAQIGSILFHSQPLILDGRARGAFVAAITTGGELQEANELIGLLSKILLILLLVGVVLYWRLAKFVLAPLTSLAAATTRIGIHNLDLRLPEGGRGELSDISRSFNAMLDRLEAQISVQKDFLRDAGHELRTPLTVLRGHVELLPHERTEEDRNQTVALLLDEIDRMSRLVDELSLLAHSERPEFLHRSTFALHALTEEVFRKASGLAARRWQLTNRGTGMLEADCDRLTQCLMNLVQNAVRHTEPEDLIEIGSLRDDDGTIRLWVSDSGSGIEPGLQDRIFDRFVRGPMRPDESGSGLGLSIVKAIMAAHGGWVNVTSVPGEGSTFTLLLPDTRSPQAQ
jgi:signal transduction histidine kinase